MKNKTSFTIDILLCVTLISSLFYCLVTSFDIKTEWYIIVIPTAIFCTIYGLLASLVKKSGVLFISVAITMIVFVFTLLFSLESILEQLSYVITQVLKLLSQYLPVQNKMILGDTLGTSATGLFVFISAILSAVFTISLIRYKRILIPSLLSMVLLVPCFILVNTLPSLVCLFIAIASLIALYISKNTRKFRPSQGGVIAAISFGTMLVVMTILLAFNPIEKYERFDWQENLLQSIENSFNIDDGRKTSTEKKLNEIKGSLEEKENLSDISPLTQTHTPVMTVTSAVGGNIYLKGTAYADYRDNIWSIISDNDAARYPQDFVPFTATIGNNALTDTRVHMLNESKIAYVPYFLESLPDNLNSVADVCVKNDTDKNEFNYSHYPFYAENTYRYNNSAKAEDYKAFVYDTYLEIPRTTQIELRRIADQEGFLDSELTVSEKIEMVKNYISNSKTYSLKTPKMPSGKDFATWFLNESDTGYCVHFATAGTLMLRALGIPARYVTGYYATAYANQTVTVTTDNAHAWVEYYSDTAGWIPLECTPSSFQPARYVGSQRASGGTQPTTVEPTTAPTAPTNGTVSHSTKSKNDIKSSFEFNGFTIAMMSLGIVALALIAIFSRRIIIIKKRKQRFETGRNNKRAICIYKELKNLTKISHILITDEVKSVYEKARFSNHTISDDELKIIENAYYNSVEEIYNNLPRIKKPYYKYIKAIK